MAALSGTTSATPRTFRPRTRATAAAHVPRRMRGRAQPCRGQARAVALSRCSRKCGRLGWRIMKPLGGAQEYISRQVAVSETPCGARRATAVGDRPKGRARPSRPRHRRGRPLRGEPGGCLALEPVRLVGAADRARAGEPLPAPAQTGKRKQNVPGWNEEASRKRYLLPDELRRWWAAVLADRDRDTRELAALLLLLGVRRGNLQRARWEQFDLASRCWRIPAEEMKAGEEHEAPLSAAAARHPGGPPQARGRAGRGLGVSRPRYRRPASATRGAGSRGSRRRRRPLGSSPTTCAGVSRPGRLTRALTRR